MHRVDGRWRAHLAVPLPGCAHGGLQGSVGRGMRGMEPRYVSVERSGWRARGVRGGRGERRASRQAAAASLRSAADSTLHTLPPELFSMISTPSHFIGAGSRTLRNAPSPLWLDHGWHPQECNGQPVTANPGSLSSAVLALSPIRQLNAWEPDAASNIPPVLYSPLVMPRRRDSRARRHRPLSSLTAFPPCWG